MEKRHKRNVSVDRLTTSRRVTRSISLKNVNENALPIPIDVIIMIFLKLPLKSIAICRCVSKVWASILRRSDFTELFLSRPCSRTPKVLFAYQRDREFFFFSSSQPQNPDENSSPLVPNYQMKFPFADCYYENGDHVNGLICFANSWKGEDKMLLKICNPSTGQAFILPKVITPIHSKGSLFGYDPIDKQFKVLVMTKGGKHAMMWDKYQILTLASGKLSWRMIECCIPLSRPTQKICIHGVIYYTSLDWPTKTCVIVCFDVRFEKFSLIKVTEIINRAMFDGTTINLINYSGKLGLLQCKDLEDAGIDGRSISCKLWVLEDLEKQVWSYHTFVFPTVPENVFAKDDLYFVGVTQTNEIVLSTRYIFHPLYLFYLNLEKKTIVRVTVTKMDGANSGRYHTFLDHVENVKLY